MSSKARTALDEIGADGHFARKEAAWRSWIKVGDSQFPPEGNRYHLYVSHACPWANRCHAVLRLKGLENVISVSVAHPTWQATRQGEDEHCGWAFASETDAPFTSSTGYGSFPATGCIPDPFYDAKFVRDLYELAKDTEGKYTVPVLWDTKTKTIVSNESADIMEMFSTAFDQFSEMPQLDLNPANLRYLTFPHTCTRAHAHAHTQHAPSLSLSLSLSLSRTPKRIQGQNRGNKHMGVSCDQ